MGRDWFSPWNGIVRGAALGADTKKDKEEIASEPAGSPEETRDIAVDPSEKAPDDLTQLLARAAMLQSQYREFGAPPRAPKESSSTTRVTDTKKDQPGRSSKDAAPGPIRWRRQASPESQRVPRPSDDDIPRAKDVDEARDVPISKGEGVSGTARNLNAEGTHPRATHANESVRKGQRQSSAASASRWSVLGQILDGESATGGDQLVEALASSVAIPFQFISSLSGGAGVTMILATLARCLATEGEHVLVADPGASSLLPLYFGANNPGEGELQSFLMPDSNAGVAIVNSGQASENSSGRPRVSKETKRDLITTIRNGAEHSDRLLLDAGAIHANDVRCLRRGTHFGLVPLVPDVGSLFGMIRLEDALRSRELEDEGRPAWAVHYVLNKFDSSLALHRDIKASLQERLRERLVPVTIRRSDAVAEALADGMTVIDYCPDAGVAEDFLRLADWLRHMAPIGQADRDNPR
jgi:cellulose synthase operon protein YhjQ